MVYLRKDVFPHVLFGTEKRTVHIRTVRFVLQVGESDRSGEKKLSRSRFSFAWSVCTGKLARRRGGHGQRQGGGGRHTRCGIPTDDNAGCACVRPSEGLRFPRKLTVFSSKKKRRQFTYEPSVFSL